MRNNTLSRLFLMCLLILSCTVIAQIPEKPAQRNFVFDYADMLDQEDEKAIIALGTQLEQASSAELVLVTVKTRGDMDIKTFANRLFNEWKLGKEDKHNGCLILLVQDNLLNKKAGRARIETGKGLGGRLNDAKCGRILDEFLLPPFLAANAPEPIAARTAIRNTYSALAQEIAQEYNVQLNFQLPEIKELMDSTKVLPPEEEAGIGTIILGVFVSLLFLGYPLYLIIKLFYSIFFAKAKPTDDEDDEDDENEPRSRSYTGGGFFGGSSGPSFGGGSSGGGGADR